MTFRNVLTNYNIYIDKVYHIRNANAYTNYIRKNLPASIQDYAIFNYLCSYKPDNKLKLDTLSALITEFSKNATQRDLAENLTENLRKYQENFETKDSKDVALLSTKKYDKPTSLDKVLNQNKGKVIYLDFWATWCTPCLAEMPNSSALSKKYTAKGAPIVFLYLSKDENMASWQAKSKQLEMPVAESFIVLKNDAFTKFCNKYSLKSIPRYMIIGKAGEMIDTDALRPGDPALKVKLDALLN
jgi:thiol-disulfide isomerase/thioredoxin